MSTKAYGYVWDQNDLKGNEKLVMLALAENTDVTGVSWPGGDKLLERTGIESNKTLTSTLNKLVEKNRLIIVRRRTKRGCRRSCLFVMNFSNLPDFSGEIDAGFQTAEQQDDLLEILIENGVSDTVLKNSNEPIETLHQGVKITPCEGVGQGVIHVQKNGKVFQKMEKLSNHSLLEPKHNRKRTLKEKPPVSPFDKGEQKIASQEIQTPKTETPTPNFVQNRKMTFVDFLTACSEHGEKAIPSDDPAVMFAERVNLPNEFMRLAWATFKTTHLNSPRLGGDWRGRFRAGVEKMGGGLWRYENGVYRLTGRGEQAKMAHIA